MSLADVFQNHFALEYFLSVSNSLDPDKAKHFVGPDLGPKCLQKLSVDYKIHH